MPKHYSSHWGQNNFVVDALTAFSGTTAIPVSGIHAVRPSVSAEYILNGTTGLTGVMQANEPFFFGPNVGTVTFSGASAAATADGENLYEATGVGDGGSTVSLGWTTTAAADHYASRFTNPYSGIATAIGFRVESTVGAPTGNVSGYIFECPDVTGFSPVDGDVIASGATTASDLTAAGVNLITLSTTGNVSAGDWAAVFLFPDQDTASYINVYVGPVVPGDETTFSSEDVTAADTPESLTWATGANLSNKTLAINIEGRIAYTSAGTLSVCEVMFK